MNDSAFNRKDTQPSKRLLPADGGAYRCPWIEDSVTILSDGTVTCGLDDAHGRRCFGNINRQSIQDIFANPEYARMRAGLAQGRRCPDCALYTDLRSDQPAPAIPTRPRRLVVEPTIRCNLRCPQSACIPNNAPGLLTRDAADLSPEALTRVLDDIGPDLDEVYFFNYGDPFMHRGAARMIADIKTASPDVQIVTSTNGIPLAARKKAEEVVTAGVDHIVFTISGMTQASYARYHVGGRLQSAMKGMRNICEVRDAAGRNAPRVSWRYLLFRWTDSPEQVEAAIALAQSLGVDEFNFYLTHIPADGWSYRMAEGSVGFAEYRPLINVAYGYSGARPDHDGLWPTETLPEFGAVRWTSYTGVLSARQKPDGTARLWLSTNAPSAAAQGGAEILLHTPWRRAYRVWVPYCTWGEVVLPVPPSRRDTDWQRMRYVCPEAWHPKDTLGVDDYRCLGVMVRHGRDTGLKTVKSPVRPAGFSQARKAGHTSGGTALTPVASALFRQFEDV